MFTPMVASSAMRESCGRRPVCTSGRQAQLTRTYAVTAMLCSHVCVPRRCKSTGAVCRVSAAAAWALLAWFFKFTYGLCHVSNDLRATACTGTACNRMPTGLDTRPHACRSTMPLTTTERTRHPPPAPLQPKERLFWCSNPSSRGACPVHTCSERHLVGRSVDGRRWAGVLCRMGHQPPSPSLPSHHTTASNMVHTLLACGHAGGR